MDAEAIVQHIEADGWSEEDLLTFACAALSKLVVQSNYQLAEDVLDAIDESSAGRLSNHAVENYRATVNPGDLVGLMADRGSTVTGDAAHQLLLRYQASEGSTALISLLEAVQRDIRSIRMNRLPATASE